MSEQLNGELALQYLEIVFVSNINYACALCVKGGVTTAAFSSTVSRGLKKEIVYGDGYIAGISHFL